MFYTLGVAFQDLPSCKHFNQMLFCSACVFASSQSAEDAVLLEQSPACRTLDFDHFLGADIGLRWDDVEVQIFPQNNDACSVLQHVTSRAGNGRFDGARLSRVSRARWRRRAAGNRRSDVAEELEHELERNRVVVYRIYGVALMERIEVALRQ